MELWAGIIHIFVLAASLVLIFFAYRGILLTKGLLHKGSIFFLLGTLIFAILQFLDILWHLEIIAKTPFRDWFIPSMILGTTILWIASIWMIQSSLIKTKKN
ncbi:MAG: hypothetical protein PHE43_00680 [Candidatus Nanoarchaeia archaeon]|nr:hypothetical protein [Candidatus Nanoarchaeia archaeon]